MTTPAPEQRSTEWHALRRNRVTGSVCGAILGLNPYTSRADIMRQMVRAREGAPDERDDLSDFAKGIMDHGRYAEDGALWDFTMETGVKTTPAPFVMYEDWLGASPDAYTADGGLLEAKAPWSKRKDAAPLWKPLAKQQHYHAQVQIELFVTKLPHAHFWQYRPGFTDKEGVAHEAVGVNEIVPFDQGWIDENLPRLAQFYAEFLSEPAYEHLLPRRAVVDTPAAAMMVREWDEIAESLDNLEARKADLLAEMVAMADDRDSLFAGRRLTKTVRKGSISYKAALDHFAPKADTSAFVGKSSEFWGLK